VTPVVSDWRILPSLAKAAVHIQPLPIHSRSKLGWALGFLLKSFFSLSDDPYLAKSPQVEGMMTHLADQTEQTVLHGTTVGVFRATLEQIQHVVAPFRW